MIKTIKKKRGTKIHVATYAISQTEMIVNIITMEHGTNQQIVTITKRVLLH